MTVIITVLHVLYPSNTFLKSKNDEAVPQAPQGVEVYWTPPGPGGSCRAPPPSQGIYALLVGAGATPYSSGQGCIHRCPRSLYRVKLRHISQPIDLK